MTTAAVDIILDDEAARIQAETLEVPHTTAKERRAAGITLCAVGARGLDLDVTDRAQLETAVAFVRPALEALGLVAEPETDDDEAPYSLCGTPAGYRRHYRRGEKPCDACRDAFNAHERATYVPKPRPRQPCGTPTAYKRHYKRGDEPCQECRDAHNAYERERRKAKRQAAR